MRKKNHAPAPVPAGNRSPMNPGPVSGQSQTPPAGDGVGFQEEDPKRRLGDFTGKGEHSLQQPGGKQGANQDPGKEQ